MPQNSSLEILKRWRAMDEALGDFPGLHIESFARDWGVSTRTVRRDLDAFKDLGQGVMHELDGRRTVWHYEGGTEYLFVSNVPRRARYRPRG
jgi:hypothetical protein